MKENEELQVNFPCKLSDLSFTFFQWCVIIHNVFGSNLDAKKNPWKKRCLPDSLFLTKLGCFISIRRYLKATPIYEFPFCRTLGRKSGNVDDTKVGMIQSGCLHINGVLLQQHVHGGVPSREWQNSTHFAFRRVCVKKMRKLTPSRKRGKIASVTYAE